MKTLFYVLFIALVETSTGVPFETNFPKSSSVGKPAADSQFLTISEFSEYKKQCEQDASEVRRVETEKTLALLMSQLQQKFSLLEQRIQTNCKKNESQSKDTYYKELEENNKRLQHDLDKLRTKVTMTACRTGDASYNGGEVIVFNDVKVQVGISDLSFFTSSGKFRCEKPGLYLVSVWILSDTKQSQFNLYKNGNFLFYTYSPNSYDRSTIVVTVELDVNDTVWVQAYYNMQVKSFGSCMTVTKIH